jgi:tetratricopeptide (TPR) repeat protein
MTERLPAWRFVFTVLRLFKGWGIEELARALHMDKGNLSRKIHHPALSRGELERLVAPMGVTRDEIDLALDFAGKLAGAGDEQTLERCLAGLGQRFVEVCRPEIAAFLREDRARRERQEAEAIWSRLAGWSAADRLYAMSEEPELWSWAVVERVCAASERAAAHDAREALKLAELALTVARKTPPERGGSPVLESYATAAVGNARRVGNDLDGADRDFDRARELEALGAGEVWAPLDPARRLDLEASLRCDQERWDEALALHDAALAAGTLPAANYVLVNKATTLGKMGDATRALAALEIAALWVDPSRETRQACIIQFNRIDNLGLLGRWEDAAKLLPAVRSLVVELGYDLDLVRLVWLEARICAGRGEGEEAFQLFEQARRGFAARNLAIDLALVVLDLAKFYLREGQMAAVKSLARQVARVCRENRLHDKAKEALAVFFAAAEQEKVTYELVERTAKALSRAPRKAA